jgi:hypothetical protein
VDQIPGALQVLEPRRGLVVDAALVDERTAKTKFDPKNVLTPGHGMFPS